MQTQKFSEGFRVSQMCMDTNLEYKVREKNLCEGLSDRPGYGLVEFLEVAVCVWARFTVGQLRNVYSKKFKYCFIL